MCVLNWGKSPDRRQPQAKFAVGPAPAVPAGVVPLCQQVASETGPFFGDQTNHFEGGFTTKRGFHKWRNQKRMVYLIEKPIQIDDMGVLTILRNHQIMTGEEWHQNDPEHIFWLATSFFGYPVFQTDPLRMKWDTDVKADIEGLRSAHHDIPWWCHDLRAMCPGIEISCSPMAFDVTSCDHGVSWKACQIITHLKCADLSLLSCLSRHGTL